MEAGRSKSESDLGTKFSLLGTKLRKRQMSATFRSGLLEFPFLDLGVDLGGGGRNGHAEVAEQVDRPLDGTCYIT